MSEVLHLCASDARVLPWKNGRGFTSELAIWPRGASFETGEFTWRISKAAVEEDGPFSSFPGFERVLVVTEGADLVLDHGDSAPQARLERLVPYRFSGDWPTQAKLALGRVADFNVLCRRGVARAEVEVWDGRVERSLQVAGTAHVFLHVLSGSLEALERRVSSGESLWLQSGGARRFVARGSATALLLTMVGAAEGI